MEYRGDSLEPDYSNLARLMELPGYKGITMLPEAFLPEDMKKKASKNPYTSLGDNYG
jgi:hypothetical protein